MDEYYTLPGDMVRQFRNAGISEDQIKKMDEQFKQLDPRIISGMRSRSTLFAELAEQYEKALPGFQREEDAHQFLAARPDLAIAAFDDGSAGLDVVSKFPLGTEFVTDFAVLGVRSYGIPYHVILVELESPIERPFTKAGLYSQTLNKAHKQILEWDNWLRTHFDEFCMSFPKHLTRHSPSDLPIKLRSAFFTFKLVIGRRESLSKEDLATRASAFQLQNGRIEIMSYDRILTQARSIAGEKIL